MRSIKNIFSKSQKITHQNEGESLTQQNFAQEADINFKVGQYMKTGILGNPAATRQPKFGNFDAPSFLEMRNAIADIQQDFASLPAKVRGRFQNDPYQLVRWVNDPTNAQEAMKMGLIPGEAAAPEATTAQAAPAATPPATTPTTPPTGAQT